MSDRPTTLAVYLLGSMFPLWLLAGITDYWCHRRSNIERTSGFAESKLHLLQALELAVPLFAGIFLWINALVLAVMIVLVLAHTATSLWDVRYTSARRYISPLEQHVHSYLDVVPVVAVLIVAFSHVDQLLALFGAGTQPASFSLQLKAEPLPSTWVAVVLAGVLGIQGVPLLEECWRTWRHSVCVKSRDPRTKE